MGATRPQSSGFFLLIGALALPFGAASQTDTTVNQKKLILVSASAVAAYTSTMIVLGQAWYSEYDKQSFQWFNDNKEWKQVDKAGHLFSAYWLSDLGSRALQSANLPQKKSDRIASAAGFVMLSSIEIFDGFSSGYGASAGDLVFNAAGSLIYLGQAAMWKEPRLIPKFSSHHTGFANLRPDVLGNGASRVLKDYNGQTYWMSADMDKFMKFPKWLNLAVGYGADEMVYGNDDQNSAAGYTAYRQFYLAIDFDLTAIPSRSKFVRGLLHVASMVRLPAPAVEFSKGQVLFHALYF